MSKVHCRPNQAQQLAALEAVKTLADNAQLMTDLFLNYDCNLQASNLYERTLKCLAKVLQLNSNTGQYYSSSTGKIRGLALDTLLLLLQALDDRAGPLKVHPSLQAITRRPFCFYGALYSIDSFEQLQIKIFLPFLLRYE